MNYIIYILCVTLLLSCFLIGCTTTTDSLSETNATPSFSSTSTISGSTTITTTGSQATSTSSSNQAIQTTQTSIASITTATTRKQTVSTSSTIGITKPILVEGARYTDYTIPLKDIEKWEYENELNNNACTMPGIIVSPFFSLRINGTDVPVFAERTTNGAHSFAYIDISNLPADGKFSLDVRITSHTARTNPIVLPESAGVIATAKGTVTTATITEFGSFTFTFDRGINGDGSSHPLTLMVKPKEVFKVPEGYKLRTFEPGEYPLADLTLTEEYTAYYFKRGEYILDGIILPSNSVLYFEAGTLLTAKVLTRKADGTPATSHIFERYGGRNIQILGRPCIDVSFRYEGMGVIFSFDEIRNMEFAGVHVVNSCGWTCCFTNCENLIIRDLLLLGYRTFSDGVMLSDCREATVSGCFVRTGDDAMEVKSTSDGSMRTRNVLFENNAVWTDKGCGYGAIYESNFSQYGVTWRNNSIGYALASWSQHLGCTTISMNGTDPSVSDQHFLFSDIEIYTSYCPVITIVLHKGGRVQDIRFQNISAKDVRLDKPHFRNPIDLIILNEDQGPLSDFSIKELYFDNIQINGLTLTDKTTHTLLSTNFPDDFVFDRTQLYINTES